MAGYDLSIRSHPRTTMKKIYCSCLIVFFLLVMSLVLLAKWRQDSINAATRAWDDIGGFVSVNSLPILGPEEVFIDLFDASSEEEVQKFVQAFAQMEETCSPWFRIMLQDGMFNPQEMDQDHVTLLKKVFGKSKVKKIELYGCQWKKGQIVDLIQSVESIDAFVIFSTCISSSELDELNGILHRDVLRFSRR